MKMGQVFLCSLGGSHKHGEWGIRFTTDAQGVEAKLVLHHAESTRLRTVLPHSESPFDSGDLCVEVVPRKTKVLTYSGVMGVIPLLQWADCSCTEMHTHVDMSFIVCHEHDSVPWCAMGDLLGLSNAHVRRALALLRLVGE